MKSTWAPSSGYFDPDVPGLGRADGNLQLGLNPVNIVDKLLDRDVLAIERLAADKHPDDIAVIFPGQPDNRGNLLFVGLKIRAQPRAQGNIQVVFFCQGRNSGQGGFDRIGPDCIGFFCQQLQVFFNFGFSREIFLVWGCSTPAWERRKNPECGRARRGHSPVCSSGTRN